MCIRDSHQAGKGSDVAVHGEDAVGHQEDAPVSLGLRLRQGPLRIVEVAVLVEDAVRLGEPDAVDDRGVVELVADDDIALLEQRAEHAHVDGVTALEDQRGLGPLEGGEAHLELLVNRLGPGDGADGAGAGAPLPRPRDRRLDHAGVGVEAEVIVAAEVDQPLAGDRHLMPLRGLQDPERVVEALRAEPVEVGGERPVECLDRLGGTRYLGHGCSDTLPQRPDLMSRIASSMSAMAKRWVISASASIAPLRRYREVSSQVAYSRRPVTPKRVTPRITTSGERSRVVGASPMPSRETHPPDRTKRVAATLSLIHI